MSNPPAYGDPDAMTHANYFIGDTDSGGVHTNSGVNNKAAYLLVDGGSLNGVTVSPIGANKTLAVYYEAQTNLLVSGSNYADLYQILYQACLNLVGGSDGVTLSDCQQVRNATEAVRMNAQPANSPDFNSDAPICGTGYQAADLFYDNLETNGDNWTSGALSGTDHWWYGKLSNSHSGTHSLYANDWPVQVTDSFVMTANAITLPAGAYLRFDHTYGFEDYQGENFDGGVVEYSLNGGSSWLDAASLFDFRGYNGSLSTAYQNPLKGRQAFVADSHGYVSSRLNLQSLAGKSVIFRWRMGLDESGYDQGWWLDDVQVYTCQKGAVGLTVSGFHSPENPGVPGNFTVTAKTSDGKSLLEGSALSFTVTAKTSDGLVATGYTGTVTFTSNDPQAVLPIQYTFQPGDAGTKTLSATLMTPGSGRTITVTDTRVSSITGSQSGITVNLIAPVAFGKLLPGLGAVAVSSAPLLSWEASPAADHYEYCYQAGEAGSCTSWINNGSATSIRLRALSPSTTYFWQVRAVNALATTYANENTEWNFTTADNDFVENATTLLIPFTFIQDTALAGKGPTDPALAKCGLAAGEASVWYKFAPITTTTLNLDTFGSNYDTQIGIFSGSPDSLVEAVCNDDASGTQQSALSLRVMAGTTYYVVISHYAGEPKILSGGEIGSTDLTTQAGGTLKLNVTTFADARSNHKYWRYIEGFYSRGITVGCSQNPLSYCADNSVTRAAMAVFMLKTKNGTAYPPPASTGIFTDVPFPGKEWMQPYVEDWYRQGITVGCSKNPRMYCPENTITRAAISVFILKLKYGNNYAPPASTGIFTDVPYPGKEWMQPYVEDAYQKGFTEACGTAPLRFCPENAVTRGDMAVFLSRAFEIAQKP